MDITLLNKIGFLLSVLSSFMSDVEQWVGPERLRRVEARGQSVSAKVKSDFDKQSEMYAKVIVWGSIICLCVWVILEKIKEYGPVPVPPGFEGNTDTSKPAVSKMFRKPRDKFLSQINSIYVGLLILCVCLRVIFLKLCTSTSSYIATKMEPEGWLRSILGRWSRVFFIGGFVLQGVALFEPSRSTISPANSTTATR